MDMKPAPKPQQTFEPTPAASPVETATDPFKPDAPISNTTVMKPKRSGKGKKFGLFLLVIALIAATGYGVYYWQHQQVDKLAKQVQGLTAYVTELNTQIDTLNANAEKAKTAAVAATVAPTTDQQVITAVQDYCQAQVDPTTAKALVFVQPTATKKVLYSTDKKFTTVSAVCGTTAATKDPAKTYYAKLSDKTWIVMYAGTTADATATKLYNIPTTFN
ncbi:MAG: hypothetical protein WCJ24_02625 [Candidatus Saccharibacteria bacterium]